MLFQLSLSLSFTHFALTLHPKPKDDNARRMASFQLRFVQSPSWSWCPTKRTLPAGAELPANAIMAGQEPTGEKFYVARGRTSPFRTRDGDRLLADVEPRT